MSEDDERWTASEERMEHRRALAERVENDLSRREQETGIDFFTTDDRFRVTSYAPSVVRRLLDHDHARIRWVYLDRVGAGKERVESIGGISPHDRGVKVEGIQAAVPIGCLSIKGVPRREDLPSGVVNTPRDAEAAAEAFRDGGGREEVDS